MSGYLVVFGKLIITYRFFNDNTFPILKLINSLQYYGIFGIIKHRAEKLGVLSMEYIKVGLAKANPFFWLCYRTLVPNLPITQINAFGNGITHFVCESN